MITFIINAIGFFVKKITNNLPDPSFFCAFQQHNMRSRQLNSLPCDEEGKVIINMCF